MVWIMELVMLFLFFIGVLMYFIMYIILFIKESMVFKNFVLKLCYFLQLVFCFVKFMNLNKVVNYVFYIFFNLSLSFS